MEVDRRDVVAEVTKVFERYETALVANDLAVLDAHSPRRHTGFLRSPCSVSCGFSEGLPVGLQLVAPPDREDLLVAVGREVEAIAAARSGAGEPGTTYTR
jgi:Asp-tRNA(Asn)/Glu-tRNA(Gln) amidotransferase A subunit family amidase